MARLNYQPHLAWTSKTSHESLEFTASNYESLTIPANCHGFSVSASAAFAGGESFYLTAHTEAAWDLLPAPEGLAFGLGTPFQTVFIPYAGGDVAVAIGGSSSTVRVVAVTYFIYDWDGI